MTLCRKCGKEIPDGEELCQECKGKENGSGEAYLDELMQSMSEELNEHSDEEPVAEPELALEEELELALEEMTLEGAEALLQEADGSLPEEESSMEEPQLEDDGQEETSDIVLEEVDEDFLAGFDLGLEEESAEEPLEESGEESVEELLEESGEESVEELLEESVEETEEEVEESEPSADNDEDINELLALLSQDYEDYEEEEPQIEETEELPEQDEKPFETTFFGEENEGDEIFADTAEELSVDDIFDDALSAVGYSEAEDEEESFENIEEITEEFVPQGEETDDSVDDFVLDELGLAGGEQEDESLALHEELLSEAEEEPHVSQPKKVKAKKEDSIWKRVFGNIITEQTAEEEAKEREAEQATAEEKALAKAEKKKELAAAKAEKAEQTKSEKEKKAAERAEQAAVKAAQKEEKKRLKAEMEANEVVGKINPIGASIVMVFFGVICILTIVGSQALSTTSSVKGAESSFEERDYREAYESLAGVAVSEDSQELKDKVRICMQLQRQLEAYDNYYELKMYLEALDSLMKGIRSYDTNISKAEQYDVVSQFNELEVKIAKQLYDEFGVSESQARSVNSIENQREYTSRLEKIIEQWEERNKQDER